MSRSRKVAAALSPTSYKGPVREVLANAASVAVYPLGLSERLMGSALDVLSRNDEECHLETPVVVVHGYGSNRSLNLRLHTSLTRAGFATVRSMNYLPFSSEGVPLVARRLKEAVWDLLAASGGDRVHLVGHSAGGIVVREAVARHQLAEVVDTAVTVASPHGGSPLSRLAAGLGGWGPFAFASQLATGSTYLADLDADARADGVSWVAYRGDLDVVVPAGRAVLDVPALGARNVLVPGEGHISIMLARALLDPVTADLLAAEELHLRRGLPSQRTEQVPGSPRA